MNAFTLSIQPPRPKTRWQRFVAYRLPNIVIALMVVSLGVAILYPYFAITVPTGHVGVLWKRLTGFGVYCWCVVYPGTVLDPRELRQEGFHIIWPWDRLFIYDLRLQTVSRPYKAISRDGVNIVATINVRYQLGNEQIAQLHKFIGPDYVELAITPEIGSRAREVIARFTAEQIYSTERSEVERAIGESVADKWGQQLDRLVQTQTTQQFQQQYPRAVQPNLVRSIKVIDTLLLNIDLPEPVVDAINRKVEQLYIAQEYDFRLDRERKESERKRIEAAGIRDFQQIVSQGISDSYVRWRGIEATLQLAQSNNAKIVIIGSGKDGLPIILGNDTASVAAAGSRALPSAATPEGTTAPSESARPSRPSTPTEKTPPGGLGAPSEVKPAPPTPPVTQSMLPFNLPNIEAIASRIRSGAPANNADAVSPSTQTPAQSGPGGTGTGGTPR